MTNISDKTRSASRTIITQSRTDFWGDSRTLVQIVMIPPPPFAEAGVHVCEGIGRVGCRLGLISPCRAYLSVDNDSFAFRFQVCLKSTNPCFCLVAELAVDSNIRSGWPAGLEIHVVHQLLQEELDQHDIGPGVGHSSPNTRIKIVKCGRFESHGDPPQHLEEYVQNAMMPNLGQRRRGCLSIFRPMSPRIRPQSLANSPAPGYMALLDSRASGQVALPSRAFTACQRRWKCPR